MEALIVLDGRHWFQVIYLDTGLIPTGMVQSHAVRDGSDPSLVRQPGNKSLGESHLAVLNDSDCDPAVSVDIDLSKPD
jgi:hypothetical protein